MVTGTHGNQVFCVCSVLCSVSVQFSLGLVMEEQLMGWDTEAAAVTELLRIFVQGSGSQTTISVS